MTLVPAPIGGGPYALANTTFYDVMAFGAVGNGSSNPASIDMVKES